MSDNQKKKNSNDPPPVASHGGGGGGKKATNPLLDPKYGYVSKKGRPGTKPTQHYTNPHGLGQLGGTQIAGVLALFGDDPILQTSDLQAARAASGIAGSNAVKPFTADQVMYMFNHASPGTRAAIQNMMYRAGGLYDKKYVPTPGGPLTQQDIKAFRKFIIGVASNPSQGGVGALLDQAATNGDMAGQASNAVYKPLIREVTNPTDIMDTANKVGFQLHGTYMSPDQMKVFTSAYQTMEKANQEQKYVAEGGDLASGMVNPDLATGATVTAPPSVQAAADTAVRYTNPTQFMANTFTDRLNEILQGLRGPSGNTTQVGPM